MPGLPLNIKHNGWYNELIWLYSGNKEGEAPFLLLGQNTWHPQFKELVYFDLQWEVWVHGEPAPRQKHHAERHGVEKLLNSGTWEAESWERDPQERVRD